MVLKASDELRHTSLVNDDYHWRESLYFNFNDPKSGIGAWLYLLGVANQPQASGTRVSFYHGAWPALSANDDAMASPGHLKVDGERWHYCYKQDADHLITAD